MLTRIRLALTATIGALTVGIAACTHEPEPEVMPASVAGTTSLCDLGTCETATVDRPIDGDTIDVVTADGTTERVRLLGVDTPETKKPDTPVQCMGPEASRLTETLAPAGAQVTLVQDDAADEHDQYGRLLRHVLVDDDSTSETSLAGELLSRGLARTTTFPHSITDGYATIEDEARDAGAGIWGEC
jgi:micrococcal nuclease